MIRQLLALLVIAGASYAFPHDVLSTAGPTPGPTHSERDSVNPEIGPLVPEDPVNPSVPLVDPERGPVNPPVSPVNAERVPEKNELVPTDVPELQDGPKPDESDLKTDATWWPYYSSWRSYHSYPSYSYWTYPSYRTYNWHWNYPQYRYYRPSYETYYSYNDNYW